MERLYGKIDEGMFRQLAVGSFYFESIWFDTPDNEWDSAGEKLVMLDVIWKGRVR